MLTNIKDRLEYRREALEWQLLFWEIRKVLEKNPEKWAKEMDELYDTEAKIIKFIGELYGVKGTDDPNPKAAGGGEAGETKK